MGVITMRIALPLLILYSLLLIPACTYEKLGNVPDPTLVADTSNKHIDDICEIYAAILTEKYASEVFVIADHADGFPCGVDRPDPNRPGQTIQNPFPFNQPEKYVILSDDETRKIFPKEQDGWRNFASKYPKSNGIVRLYEISFDEDRTQASVNVVHQCGLLCGEGRDVFLRKKDGKWFIFSENQTVVF